MTSQHADSLPGDGDTSPGTPSIASSGLGALPTTRRAFVSPRSATAALGAGRPSVVSRLWSGLLALWGAFIGLVPHVLHHVGPLAGAAFLAGSFGTALFAIVGIVAAIPFLRRLHRRFMTWRAPALALAIFAAMFTFSSLVIGPAVSGDGKPALEQDGGGEHDAHH